MDVSAPEKPLDYRHVVFSTGLGVPETSDKFPSVAVANHPEVKWHCLVLCVLWARARVQMTSSVKTGLVTIGIQKCHPLAATAASAHDPSKDDMGPGWNCPLQISRVSKNTPL